MPRTAWLPLVFLLTIAATLERSASAQGAARSGGQRGEAVVKARSTATAYAAKAYGGKWKAKYRPGNGKSGEMRVDIAKKNPLRRWFSSRGRGTVWVGSGGEVARERLVPGRARTAIAKGARAASALPRRLWNSQTMTALRSGSTLKMVVGAAAASYIATRFGYSYDQILPLTTSVAAAVLAKDVQIRRQHVEVADRLASELIDLTSASDATSPRDRARAEKDLRDRIRRILRVD
jgi:hypothetical protein